MLEALGIFAAIVIGVGVLVIFFVWIAFAAGLFDTED
jgi:hypothetical protein